MRTLLAFVFALTMASLAVSSSMNELNAQTIQKVAELQPRGYSSYFMSSGGPDPLLHPDGYVFIGREWLRDASREATGIAYAYMYLPTQKTGVIQLPYKQLREQNARLLTRGRMPVVHLVAFDGEEAGFVIEDGRRANQDACVFHGWDRRYFYFTMDVDSGELSALSEIGAPGVRESFYAIGVDDEYLYQALYSNDAGCSQYRTVTLRRTELESGEVDDWSMNLQTNGVMARPRFTGDRDYLAILNYTERGVKAKNPADGYIIDPEARKTWRFRIPVTPYAIACDDAQCMLGSSQAGTVSRLRLSQELANQSRQGKSETVARGLGRMNHFVVTPGGQRVLLFWNSIVGAKHVEARDFPAMTAAKRKKFSTAKFFGAPRGFRPETMVWSADGGYILLPKPGANGFSDDSTVLVFKVTD